MHIVELSLKIFFIITPFFVLSTFLSLTIDCTESERRKTALKTVFAVLISCIVLFFAGQLIFDLFGITLDSFRVGTGALLFLSAVKLVNDKTTEMKPRDDDISVVPLAIPITVGPATTGTILVMGAEMNTASEKVHGILSIVIAVFFLTIILYLSGSMERLLKKKGVSILSKLTGLIVAAISAQMILTGVKGFLD